MELSNTLAHVHSEDISLRDTYMFPVVISKLYNVDIGTLSPRQKAAILETTLQIHF